MLDPTAIEEVLTPRWTPLERHPVQMAWMQSKARFNVVPAGRRSGKTERAKRKLVRYALDSTLSKFPNPRYFAGAPTRQQAKDIWWNDLKLLSPRHFIKNISESELRITYINGASITVVGLDKPERIEGQPWDGGELDEYGNMKKQAWDLNIYPALSDRDGWCDLIGVPEGRNHYFDTYQKALTNASGDWGVFHWKSSELAHLKRVVETARHEMDELSFQQEYEASFVNFQGRIYYTFDRNIHVSSSIMYHKNLPIIFCFDFNIAPGVAAILQEQPELPNGLPGTAVIGEVYIPQNSNTPAVCRKLVSVWGKHRAGVYCYGDATGGAPGSAKVLGSDWDLIRKELRPVFGETLKFMVPDGNPAERARVNAMNTRMLSGVRDSRDQQIIRLMVHNNCKNVIKDFEGVRCLEGGSGEIDKDIDDSLTHISDAIGYYVHAKFPVVKGIAQQEF